MLTEQEIQKALHASRVVPIPVANPHGPLGLEQLAQAVAHFQCGGNAHESKVIRPLELSVETWLKLEQLADAATQSTARPISVSEVAAAILQQYVSANR